VRDYPNNLYVQIMPSTGWKLFVAFTLDDEEQIRLESRMLLWLSMWAVFTLIVLVAVCVSATYHGGTKSLWVASALVSLVLLCGISFVWFLVIAGRLEPPDPGASHAILAPSDVRA